MGIKICRCSLALFFRLRGDVRSCMVIIYDFRCSEALVLRFREVLRS